LIATGVEQEQDGVLWQAIGHKPLRYRLFSSNEMRFTFYLSRLTNPSLLRLAGYLFRLARSLSAWV